MNIDYKTIKCASCGKELCRILAKIKSVQVIDCRDCRIRNIYNPLTDETETKEMPIRATSSGYTFW